MKKESMHFQTLVFGSQAIPYLTWVINSSYRSKDINFVLLGYTWIKLNQLSPTKLASIDGAILL